MYQLLDRKSALNQGLKRYYTGRPCSRGHDAQRLVTTGNCVKCNAERSATFKSDASAMQTARQQGLFTYRLHPDDHATLLACAQALDLARGRIPQVKAEERPVFADLTPEEIQRIREHAFGKVFKTTEPQSVDTSEAWLSDVR